MEYKYEQVEILVEEPSMESFLKNVLPKILPEGYGLDINVFIRPHNGKSDLIKSVPKKVKAFSNFHKPVKIVILHDQDSNDCIKLKKDILKRCESAGDCPVLVRIACRELENWYLGNMYAIEGAYPAFKASKNEHKSKFRDPDHPHGSEEMEKLVKNFQKGLAARKISLHIDFDKNRSRSLAHFYTGIRRFLAE